MKERYNTCLKRSIKKHEGGGGGGGGSGGGGGGGGNSTQDDKGATQSTRELPELVPGAPDTSNKDGKKLQCRVSQEMVTVEKTGKL